jgi:hypothetical protein
MMREVPEAYAGISAVGANDAALDDRQAGRFHLQQLRRHIECLGAHVAGSDGGRIGRHHRGACCMAPTPYSIRSVRPCTTRTRR